jgi:tRNA-splicing ligase RtcB (3'-phosphate/5'-hydroxy nucleic acid ligase)
MTTTYKTWGADGIQSEAFDQMRDACAIPCAVAGALMPDAHLGYGLPIGGVLALDNCVSPYGVGVDIACRMKLTVFGVDPHEMEFGNRKHYIEALEGGTFFGVGQENDYGYDHPVLHEDWGITEVTKGLFEKGKAQLGTSGSGNHFAELGVYTHLATGQRFLSLMTHSGSRGSGAQVCNHYSKIAKERCPDVALPYLDLSSPEGQEYWAAMNLMGKYAAANHDCIHNTVGSLLGFSPIKVIENHHNFAWKEIHGGKEVIVHRKGATPAGKGVLGVIPGSMGTPAYVVEGLGEATSLASASHGAGRLMSRKQAKKQFTLRDEMMRLKAENITVLSCGADEVPGVYKNIDSVMAAQTDLVRPIAKFQPLIVKMSNDGKRED